MRLTPFQYRSEVEISSRLPAASSPAFSTRTTRRSRNTPAANRATGNGSAPVIESHFRDTVFLDDAERLRAHRLLAEDQAWLARA